MSASRNRELLDMDRKIYRRAVDLLEAEVNDEVVALEPANGSCFGFNLVATQVWRELAQPRSFKELKDELLRNFEVSDEQCAAELQQLLNSMQAEGLIEAA
jgi:Coenzyme PQQ synthesis protein D (PqqD)